jgi:hypothetical protein
VDSIQEQLATAAEAGGAEARALAERLTAALDSAVRLTLLEALDQAATEITRELAPGSVQLRLHGGSPEFVVQQPAPAPEDPPGSDDELTAAAIESAMSWVTGGSGEREMVRLNLRLPEPLKARIDEAADRSGLSTNAWLVRVAAAAVQSEHPGGPRELRRDPSGRTYRGWVR